MSFVMDKIFGDSDHLDRAIRVVRENRQRAVELNRKMQETLEAPPDAVDRLIGWHKDGLLKRAMQKGRKRNKRLRDG